MNTKDFLFCPMCQEPLHREYEKDFLMLRCLRCNEVIYPGPKVGVAVIIEHHEKVLLVKRKHEPFKSKWWFPAGYMEIGETAEEAAIREVKEETSFDIELTGLFGVYTDLEDPRGETLIIVYEGGHPEKLYAGGIAGEEIETFQFCGQECFDPRGGMYEELALGVTLQIAIDYMIGRAPRRR